MRTAVAVNGPNTELVNNIVDKLKDMAERIKHGFWNYKNETKQMSVTLLVNAIGDLYEMTRDLTYEQIGDKDANRSESSESEEQGTVEPEDWPTVD